MSDSPTPTPHNAFEDGYALVTGCSLLVLALICLKASGIVTGGVAGIALLTSYLVPLSPGLLYTLINLPFFIFAKLAMGNAFMLKTMAASLGITLFSLGAPHVLGLGAIDPLFGALFGGTMAGLGILILARHKTGVGGTGVMVLWLAKTRGWNAGRTQLVIDLAIIVTSLVVIPPARVLLSALSAAALSGVLIAFHRPGRYTGY